MYRSFIKPTISAFTWVGAEQVEVLFLNKFQWSSQGIPWHDLLLLLESEPVHFPVPKTHYAHDILLMSATHQYLKQVPLSYSLLKTEMMKVR